MSSEIIISENLVKMFQIWSKHGFLACWPRPSDRLRRSGNLWRWSWTISCSASSWPFASLARWPSSLEDSSNSTWGENGQRVQVASKQHDEGRSWGHHSWCCVCFLRLFCAYTMVLMWLFEALRFLDRVSVGRTWNQFCHQKCFLLFHLCF